MANEKDYSSPSQNSPEPDGILRILASAFSGVLFGLFLSKLKAPIQESVHNISPKTQADNTNRKTQPESLSANNSSPSPSSSDSPCKCCHHKTPRWKIALDVGMFIATVGAFGAAAYYAHISKKMWNEMQAQTQTARDQLELSERPWIDVRNISISNNEDIFFWKNAIGASIVVDMKNIGHSPAINVITHVEVHSGAVQPIEIMKGACDRAIGETYVGGFGETVFPEKPGRPISYVVNLPKDEVLEYWKEQHANPGSRILFIAGCVAYRSPAFKERYYTGFFYDVFLGRYPSEPTKIPAAKVFFNNDFDLLVK